MEMRPLFIGGISRGDDKMRQICLLIWLVMFISGCATTTSTLTSKISLGMTKEQVLQVCGKPFKSGATSNPRTGQSVEALVYKSFDNNPWSNVVAGGTPDISYVNIYFKDGKVIQYGANADWMTEADFEGERKIKITTDGHIKHE